MQQFKKLLFNLLEKQAVKLVLKKLVLASGFQAYLVTFIVEQLFDHVAIPIMNLSIRKGELYYDQIEGKIQIKRLHNSKDLADYDRNLDNILN